ncbi:hypothetical protein FANTH_13685 [Fusarium anthophilum]|uniref:Fungal-type protein kinase domain-containing protein n=1 Tax=Fusarium anthophilum TaxID=48485 RepID=A0A8H5DP98_9HYPO|nr:hypothetical protein FANTH_13685 [Fusarium anthophilum]
MLDQGKQQTPDLDCALNPAYISPTSHAPRKYRSRCAFRSDLLGPISAAASLKFAIDAVKPLLKSALASKPNALIWDQVYDAVVEHTPPHRPIASFLQQTPWLRNTSSFANSSEHDKYVDDVLKEELGLSVLQAVCGMQRSAVCGRLEGRPNDASQDDVLSWSASFGDKLATSAGSHESNLTNPSADKALTAWLDLGKYSGDVLAAQNTRGSVLSLTICRFLMRYGHLIGSGILLVIKDPWRYPERDEEEGELLREATVEGIVNAASYYHPEMDQIDGADDDIRNNVQHSPL